MNNIELVKLCSRAWSTQAILLLSQGTPGRVSPVAHATGASRSSMSATFQHLIELGFLERAPGHGHPLRNEFRLTAKGARFATQVESLGETLNPPDWSLCRKQWTFPVLRILEGPQGFGEIRKQLAPIPDRSLSLSLKSLCQQGWVAREVVARVSPPAVIYNTAGKGREISNIMQAV